MSGLTRVHSAATGSVVGLCCTEFGMFFADRIAPWPVIDSTLAHVKALLDY